MNNFAMPSWRSAMQMPQSNQYKTGLGMPTQNAQGGWSLPVPAPPQQPMAQTPPPAPPMPMTAPPQPQANTWAAANGLWTPQGMRYPVETLGWLSGAR